MSYILNVILLKDTGNEMLDKKKGYICSYAWIKASFFFL